MTANIKKYEPAIIMRSGSYIGKKGWLTTAIMDLKHQDSRTGTAMQVRKKE